MSLLNLNGPAGKAPRSKNSSRAWMGIGLVIAVLGIGSTFASSITINNGSDTEFGQGVQRTVYCGGTATTLTVAPISAYKNKSGTTTDPAGTFYVTGIRVSNIPTACDGVNFVVSLYDTSADTSALPIAYSSSATLVTPTVYWRTSSSNGLNGVYKGPTVTGTPGASCQVVTANKWSGTGGGYGALLSLSRTQFVDPCSVAYLSVKANTFQINVKSGSGITNADIITAGRIVIETQEDTFGSTTVKSDESGKTAYTYGLIYDGLS